MSYIGKELADRRLVDGESGGGGLVGGILVSKELIGEKSVSRWLAGGRSVCGQWVSENKRANGRPESIRLRSGLDSSVGQIEHILGIVDKVDGI